MIRLALAAVLAAVASTAAVAASPAAPPLARVGDDVVTGDDVKQEFVRRHGGHAKFLGGVAEVHAFLAIVIDRRLLLQEAYRLELQELPPIRSACDALAERKAVELLLARELDAKAAVTEEEILAAWETRTTELYQFAQIAVATRNEAESVAAELAAGADFGELARNRSLASTRLRGGAMGEIGWGSMPPEWESVAFALAPGEDSEPFAVDGRWEVVRLVSKRTAEKPELEKARTRIEWILRQRKLEVRRRELSDELRELWHARLAMAIDGTPAVLAELLVAAPETPIASWEGGELELATFARGIDLGELARLPEAEGRARLEDLVRRTVNDALIREEVKARRLTEDPGVAVVVRLEREKLMENALYADHVLKGVAVSDSEVRVWYEEHLAEFSTAERRRMSQLVVATREEAAELAARVARGESFEELVSEHSKDLSSAKNGGDLGWVTAKQVPPEFAAVLALGQGALSEPIASEHGWHLMKVTAIEPPRPQPFEEVREALAKRLLERAKTARRALWVEQLRAATEIELDEQAIEAFAKESSGD